MPTHTARKIQIKNQIKLRAFFTKTQFYLKRNDEKQFDRNFYYKSY